MQISNAMFAWNYLSTEATDYNNSALNAAINGTALYKFSDDELNCLHYMAAYAKWLANGQATGKDPLNGLTCQKQPLFDRGQVTTFFSTLADYQFKLIDLNSDLRDPSTAPPSKKAAPSSNNSGATKTPPTDFQTQLKELDLSADLPNGSSGQQLAQKEQNLQPFGNLDPTATEISYPVWGQPRRPDTTSNSLTVVALNQFESSMNLSPAVRVVGCAGVLSISAGGGYSRLPLVSYQVLPTVTNGVVTANVIAFAQNSRAQTVAAGFFHYYLLPLGQQAGLFATAGIGTSTTKLSGFYGLSIGIARRVYLNVAENVSGVTGLAPGFSINEPVPNGFSIPTTTHTMTRLSITLSIGGGVATSPASSGSPPASGKKSP
jgi:hypothetical protein